MEDLLQNKDFVQLAALCEQKELEAPNGITTADVYGTLLAVYILQNELNYARFLWKRIPDQLKKSNSELGSLWSVGQNLWKRDFPATHAALKQTPWPPHLEPIVDTMRVQLRMRILALVGQAYDAIGIEDLAVQLSLSPSDTLQEVSRLGWAVDGSGKIVRPKSQISDASSGFSNQKKLEKMTEYVSFLENQ
ncbi:COP9 signalosome complex subunit 8-like [Oscarella lobularis]|uniref:COP9 signalosome complex subunit 8-like n=1 Tax=Oscarella lobularis TaxID=121494 RepID=UPI0033141922